MTDELAGARALLPGLRMDVDERLRGSDRAQVLRVRTKDAEGRRGSLIVKTFRGAGEGWARESAALTVLPEAAPAPTVVALGAEPPVVVMTDAGNGPTVADALLGEDPGVAAEAVGQWAEAVAGVHGASLGSRDAFCAALDERAGDLPLDDQVMPTWLHDAARALPELCAGIGVGVHDEALSELRSVASRLGGDGACALSPTDTCPDNNVRSPAGMVLVDFEGAEWRHVAWDVAYLTVPWPSCWCAWRLPDHVAVAARERYVVALAPALPYVATPEFDRDVAAAVVAWAVLSTSWFLSRGLSDDPPPDDARPTPTRRAMILHRLGTAEGSPQLPVLAGLAGALRAELLARWGDVPLHLAPAFR